MLRAILIDDEPHSLNALRLKLEQHCPEVNILACCQAAKDGIEAIDSLMPDILFLDIEMPLMNGFTLLQQTEFKSFDVIFVTAYEHYAIKAIKWSALDYLVKPVDVEDLVLAVGRAKEKQKSQNSNQQVELLITNIQSSNPIPDKIAIHTADGLQFIETNQIVYLEASGNYAWLYSRHKPRLLVSKTLKDFEEMLPASAFFRTHNSYIVNLAHIAGYTRGEGGQIQMTDGTLLDVSRRKKAAFIRAMGLSQ